MMVGQIFLLDSLLCGNDEKRRSEHNTPPPLPLGAKRRENDARIRELNLLSSFPRSARREGIRESKKKKFESVTINEKSGDRRLFSYFVCFWRWIGAFLSDIRRFWVFVY
jgi:hypothetical protein